MTQHEEEQTLWEAIFSRENLLTALHRVQSNKGAAGVDGMTVEELPEHLKAHWLSIRAKLEERGLRFVRYADDSNIYVKSERAAERVLASTRRYVEGRMRLKVNEAKSAVGLAVNRQFLGFSFY